ncbi:MurR/RpiR family transcriptional regulator [Neofamilia massiliensis]|uniref:MurR/RpiR family transcriptional regulator n=1 Tax=Neofamilia massiliensis TaxID=1673724 RepID=UPI0006BB9953|nr:MurR/RpiR family transcriptional regulator [Neofamilia massiliensis]
MKLISCLDDLQLTKSEIKILEFIETNYDDFLFMSIIELAEKLEISEATISRFVRKIGADDFKSLKTLVLEQSPYMAAEKMKTTLASSEDLSLDSYLSKQIENIKKTLDHIDKNQFDQACKILAQKNKIYVYAKHAGKALTSLIYTRLNRIGIDVWTLPTGGTELVESLSKLEKDDLLLIFSFSKISREDKIIFDYKKEVGFKLIQFTSRLYHDEENSGDLNLFVYRGERNEYHSLTTPVALADAMIVKITKLKGEKSLERLEKIKDLKNKYKDFK